MPVTPFRICALPSVLAVRVETEVALESLEKGMLQEVRSERSAGLKASAEDATVCLNTGVGNPCVPAAPVQLVPVQVRATARGTVLTSRPVSAAKACSFPSTSKYTYESKLVGMTWSPPVSSGYGMNQSSLSKSQHRCLMNPNSLLRSSQPREAPCPGC